MSGRNSAKRNAAPRLGWSRLPRLMVSLLVPVVLVLSGPAAAFEQVPYSNAVITAARAENRAYIINVHADWCTTCQAQDRVLDQLRADPRFANLLIVMVDYDTGQHIMRAFNVTQRSTYVAFRGATEIGRMTAITSFEGIEAFLLSAVQQ